MTALILMSLLVLFGYRAIGNMRARGEQAKYIEFRSRITGVIGSTMDFGSGRRVTMGLPGAYTGLCFIDNEVAINYLGDINDPIISGHIEDGLKENLFLIKGMMAEPPPIYAGEIKLDPPGMVCVSEELGKVTFKIEGFGKYAKILPD
ncbi:hypothetical protein KY360_00565 [Candidatus Woesearchaeota archaeon]|nr:hypothetical protein [Candidatus Woesearchaeota archaeon]